MVLSETNNFTLPPEHRFTYLFHGVIHPARANVSLFDLGTAKAILKTKDSSVSAFVNLKGENSEFLVTVHVDREVTDILTLRNLIRNHVNGQLDILVFFQGTYYESEIVACTPPNGEKFDFGVELTAISALGKDHPKRVDARKLITHSCFPHFARALRDFKMAMKEPSESFFLVFRAIETIRVRFAIEAGIDAEKEKSKSWKYMRERMKYREEDFAFLQNDATARRHGDQRIHSEKEIVDCLIFGWLFLYRFLEVSFGADFASRIDPRLESNQ